MLSLGMLAERHLSRTMRRRGFIPGSPPPMRAAIVISLLSLAKIFPRLASIAPLKCLTLAHLLCPAITSMPESSFPDRRTQVLEFRVASPRAPGQDPGRFCLVYESGESNRDPADRRQRRRCPSGPGSVA